MPTNTIAENLELLQEATEAIAQAITDAGGTVGSDDGLVHLASDISTIPIHGSGNVTEWNPNGDPDWDSNWTILTCLTSIEIPEGAESLKMNNFPSYGTPNLRTIILPSTVTSIDVSTFVQLSAQLTEIIINKPQDSISGAPWGAMNATVTWTG